MPVALCLKACFCSWTQRSLGRVGCNREDTQGWFWCAADWGGSSTQESSHALRAGVCSTGRRGICLNVLVWVRSALLKQVRSLFLLPADVRVDGLGACRRVSLQVLLNQKMFSTCNAHSVRGTRLVLAEGETIWIKGGPWALGVLYFAL